MIVFLDAASLVGQSAPPEVMQKLTYLVIRHPQVKRIDTVRAYTFGVLYFVEVVSFLSVKLNSRNIYSKLFAWFCCSGSLFSYHLLPLSCTIWHVR